MRSVVPEPFQSGRGQNNSIELAGVEFAQTCIDVTAQSMQIQSRESMPQLNLTPQTAGPDRCAGRQILKFRTVRDECIAWIFAFRNRGEVDSIGKLKWNILQAVHGKIDAAVEQRFVDFLREQTLAADLRQRHVQNLVARLS